MKKKRVLVLNNYPMDRVLKEVELGETPDHVLFGVNRLAALGYAPVFLPYPAEGRWSNFQHLLGRLRHPLELGDLQQQMLALPLVRGADLIYAPCGSQTHFLQYLRAIGWLKIPVVTLMHHPFPKGKLDFLRGWQRRLFMQGADRLPSLSQALADDLQGRGCPAYKLEAMPWGADMDFYGPWQRPGSGVIATGRTGRDFKTFALAACRSACPSTIICLRGHLDTVDVSVTGGLRVIEAPDEQPVPGQKRGWMKYPELCSHMRAHSAVAIPLFAQESLAGVTSLMDAIGLGRAVLMTRNPHVDLDIEAEGIGFWLDAGDVDGWREKLDWVAAHPDQVEEMGVRAHALGMKRYNSVAFATRLIKIMEDALEGNR
jgi:glycosyltransferase involved in cell wall biosynthesis